MLGREEYKEGGVEGEGAGECGESQRERETETETKRKMYSTIIHRYVCVHVNVKGKTMFLH